MTCPIDPVHAEIAGCLFVTLEHAIHIDSHTGRGQVSLLIVPFHVSDPVDSTGCGTNKVEASREDAHPDRGVVQQFLN